MKRLLVSVGTDHHPFDRLVLWADKFAADHEDVAVLVQYGSAAPPTHAQGSRLLDHAQMQTEIARADVVVCHGGPATITEVRRNGHVPICVPRNPANHEHVDAHQLRFVARLAKEGLVNEVNDASHLTHVVNKALERPRRSDRSSKTSLTEPGLAQGPAGVRRIGELIDELVSPSGTNSKHPDPVPVLYIGGQGRSGSTLLERAVGQFEGLVNVGEIVHLWRRGVRDNELCGCGLSFSRCEFWQAVGNEAFGGWNSIDAEAAVSLRYAVDRTRYLPLLLRPSLSPAYAARHAEHVDRLGKLYRAMATVSGARVLVDSSKHASYALLLAATPGIDLRLLHVVRDSRAVAHAWSKKVERPEAAGVPMPTYGPTKASVMWDLQNTIIQRMGRQLPYQRVRYEDFVEAPKDALLDIVRFVGLGDESTQLTFLDGDTVHLLASHTVAGNPMRFTTGDVTIRRDDKWRAELPPGRRKLVEALTSPLQHRYGYSKVRP